MIIRDATNGNGAAVAKGGELLVKANSAHIQHHHALEHGDVYQIVGEETALNNATHPILHIKNTSTTQDFCVTYIRMQALDMAGGTAIPNVATYFDVVADLTYSSGGTAVTPVNTSRKSGRTASLTCYNDTPTLAGTAAVLDKWYVESEGKMMTFNKNGSIILGQNDTLCVRCTTDHTSGIAYARITGVFI